MKKLLDKKISVSIKSILVILLVIALSVTAIGAESRQIQATLSPDISISFNGARQNLRDANGNAVYPVVYEGTTYLPIRAVAELTGFGVNWDGSTRTVNLTNRTDADRVRLTDIATTNYGVSATTDMARFPDYDFGFRLTGFNFAYRVNSNMPFNGRYSTLTFDVAMVRLSETGNFNPLNIDLLNADTNTVLWSGRCEPGEIISGVSVDISGVETLRWSFNGGGMQGQQIGYILNPYVN